MVLECCYWHQDEKKRSVMNVVTSNLPSGLFRFSLLVFQSGVSSSGSGRFFIRNEKTERNRALRFSHISTRGGGGLWGTLFLGNDLIKSVCVSDERVSSIHGDSWPDHVHYLTDQVH